MKYKRKWFRITPAEIIVLMVIGVLALIVVTDNLSLILEKLFSRYAAFVVVLMVFEYLLLKGSDRSAIYQRELQAARVRRRDDLLALREIESRLIEQRVRLAALSESEGNVDSLRQATEKSKSDIQEVLGLLRERI